MINCVSLYLQVVSSSNLRWAEELPKSNVIGGACT